MRCSSLCASLFVYIVHAYTAAFPVWQTGDGDLDRLVQQAWTGRRLRTDQILIQRAQWKGPSWQPPARRESIFNPLGHTYGTICLRR